MTWARACSDNCGVVCLPRFLTCLSRRLLEVCSSFSKFCVDQVSGKSVSSLDLTQPLVVLSPHPWRVGAGTSVRSRTPRVTGMAS